MMFFVDKQTPSSISNEIWYIPASIAGSGSGLSDVETIPPFSFHLYSRSNRGVPVLRFSRTISDVGQCPEIVKSAFIVHSSPPLSVYAKNPLLPPIHPRSESKKKAE